MSSLTGRNKRLKLRAVGRDAKGSVVSVIEQEVPSNYRDIENALRRRHFRSLISCVIVARGSVTLEVGNRV